MIVERLWQWLARLRQLSVLTKWFLPPGGRSPQAMSGGVQGLARRFQRAAFGLTMLVVALLGVAVLAVQIVL